MWRRSFLANAAGSCLVKMSIAFTRKFKDRNFYEISIRKLPLFRSIAKIEEAEISARKP